MVSLEEKLEVINWLEKGEHIANVCCALGLASSMLCILPDDTGRPK
jgi:hypothetical protein